MLQDGDADGSVSGWGWADNGWGTLGSHIYFASTGAHTIRVQQREDGAIVDQIVLSPDVHLSAPPGRSDNDATVLPATDGGSTGGGSPSGLGPGDILLHPADAAVVVGDWTRDADLTAAGSASLLNPNRHAAKLVTALAAPSDYFEMTFDAQAHTPYRLWLRAKATGDYWGNDSVHVQFDASVAADGTTPTYRIGTTDSTVVNLEDCSGCGLSGWGWQDNGWGVGVLGPPIYFPTSGTRTIRVQPREDG